MVARWDLADRTRHPASTTETKEVRNGNRDPDLRPFEALCLIGPEINRRTEDNIAAAGLDIVDVRRVGVWSEIPARRSLAAGSGADAHEPQQRRSG